MTVDLTKLPWWSKGAWQPPSPQPPTAAPLIEFNPTCQHTRASYDIVNCDACREFSDKVRAGRAVAAAKMPCDGAFWMASSDGANTASEAVCSACRRPAREHL
jgi:hypothetical protein